MKYFTNKFIVILGLFILTYTIYFSYFSILRYKTIYASYYDLGIMNQTVYNTYQGIKTGDFSRILEMTDTEKPIQIKRMAIHNDILLGLLALFYFIFAGPETLLVIQTIILALGAIAVFGIVKHVFSEYRILNTEYKNLFAFLFSIAYLLYPPMQRANIFDFHAVTFATSFLLFMFYFWLKKKYFWSIIFFVFSLMAKENVGLTTACFGAFVMLSSFQHPNQIPKQPMKQVQGDIVRDDKTFSLLLISISVIWVVLSFLVIIPYFRGEAHFASSYYDINKIISNILHIDTFRYFWFLLGPLGFLSILSPLLFLISLPELAINLLSSNWNMRNIVYHYTSVIQPWVFISAIYGTRTLFKLKIKNEKLKIAIQNLKLPIYLIIITTIIFSYFKSPLPLMREQEIYPFKHKRIVQKDVDYWAEKLKDESLKISTTGQIAPVFTSRRYFYLFSDRYVMADFIVLRREEVYNYPEKEQLIPVYEKLTKDKRFEKIYDENDLEVYKKIN